MKKLLIIQNYNANKGDSSVIHTMKNTLKKADPSDLDIAVTSYDPEKATEEYGLVSAEWIINFRDIKLAKGKRNKLKYTLKEGSWIVYSMVWLLARKLGVDLKIPEFKKKTIDLYLNSEVVVLPGGHFFTNLNGFSTNFSHFYGLLFAYLLDKKTMIYAETIGPFFGPFGKLTRRMTRFIGKKVDLITVREKNSLTECQDLDNVQVTAESVFALEAADPETAKELVELKKTDKLLVGVTIHHIYWKHYFTREKYISLMAGIFDRITSDYNAEILIIPMEMSMHKGGDRPIAQEMIDTMKTDGTVRILEGDLDPITTAAVIAQTDLFIGTKTHSIVYGLKSAVPTISISYQQKSNEFMDMFGMLDNAINLEELDVDRFMEIFANLHAEKDSIRQRQAEALVRVREAALKNNSLLLNLFRK